MGSLAMSSGPPRAGLQVLQKDPNRGWRKSGAAVAVQPGGLQQLRDAFVALLKAQAHRQVADFDDHLDDVSKWVSELILHGSLVPGV